MPMFGMLCCNHWRQAERKQRKAEEERETYNPTRGNKAEKALPKRMQRIRPNQRLFGYHVEKVRARLFTTVELVFSPS